MKRVYGYVRVSDKKQDEGISDEVQRYDITQHAKNNDLKIIGWFEETRSAFHSGRPAFKQMLQKVRQKKADGVIFHRVDRSARNGGDWQDLMKLHDNKGVLVEFAFSRHDLTTRSGRLMAEIEAVMAADFSRNLRDVVTASLYRRLENGIYPFAAPVGYLNTGKGNPKAIDESKACHVIQMFEMYATGDHTLDTLKIYADQNGFTNTKNNPFCVNSISLMLHNPFYTGLMRVKGNLYQGSHKPLIDIKLFEQVQAQFKKHKQPQVKTHNPLLKRLVRCQQCRYAMSAEKQKGRYYYRCRQKTCPTKCIREDQILLAFSQELKTIQIDQSFANAVVEAAKLAIKNRRKKQQSQRQSIRVKRGQMTAEVDRMTDLVIRGTLDDDTYKHRKNRLVQKIRKIDDEAEKLSLSHNEIKSKVEQATALCLSVDIDFLKKESASVVRDIIKTTTANFYIDGKKPTVKLKEPYDALLSEGPFLECVHEPSYFRTSLANSASRCERCSSSFEQVQKFANAVLSTED